MAVASHAEEEGKAAHMDVKVRQLPEWEHIAAANHTAFSNASPRNGRVPSPLNALLSIKAAFFARLDQVLPPHKRYTKHQFTRKTIITAALAVTMLFITALVVGLAAALPSQE